MISSLMNIDGFLYEVERIDETHVRLTMEYSTSRPRVYHVREFIENSAVYEKLLKIVSKRS